MAIVGIILWWYSTGFVKAIGAVGRRIEGLFDFFSIDLLLKTLFSPFRQISAGKVDGPLTVQLQALLDKLVSRLIGAAVRTVVIFVGALSLLVVILGGIVYLLVWLLMPLMPVIGLGMALLGWVPWQA